MEKTSRERFFSVELKSKICLNNVTMTNGGRENVLVEGTIGNLRHAMFVEGIVLEVVGDKGTLRINLALDEIKMKSPQDKEI